MKTLFAWLTLSVALCRAGTLFCGAYPDVVLVVDEATGKVGTWRRWEAANPERRR